MMRDTAYLILATNKLDGLIAHYVGASSHGLMVNVSLWQDNGHADHMSSLKEMTVR